MLKNLPDPTLTERIYALLAIHPDGLSLPQLSYKLRASRYADRTIEETITKMVSSCEVRVTNKVFWIAPRSVVRSEPPPADIQTNPAKAG